MAPPRDKLKFEIHTLENFFVEKANQACRGCSCGLGTLNFNLLWSLDARNLEFVIPLLQPSSGSNR
jgi:hypothetical protein